MGSRYQSLKSGSVSVSFKIVKRLLLCGTAFMCAVLVQVSGCRAGATAGDSAKGLLFPRVLILSTGTDGFGTLPAGANVALETFDELGAQTWIGDKTSLLEPARLARYRIIIAPTVFGYHDGDRIFSLTYLDETMLGNLTDWVQQGGILIGGENVGRNTIDGIDRVVSDELLDEAEWPLARVFGFRMKERNMNGFSLVRAADPGLVGDYGTELGPELGDDWLLVPDSILGESMDVLAWWTDGTDSVPGVTLNRFGQGCGIYISAFRILHPSVAGGMGDVPEIKGFYSGVFGLACGGTPAVYVNPWPNAARAAVAVTLDDGGNLNEFQRTVVRLLDVPRVETIDMFVCGEIPDDVLGYLRAESRIRLANHSQTHPFFDKIDYSQAIWEIAHAESWIGETDVFRYPYVSPSPAGMLVLAQRGYRVESSIRIDHRHGYAGALFPYNLPVFERGSYYLTTEVLELSPVQSDWPFYGDGVKHKPYPEERQRTDAEMFRAELGATWRDIIRPNRGMMVVMGHPMYMGHSDITLEPMVSFLKELEQDVWFSDLTGIHDWWRVLENVEVRVSGNENMTRLWLVNHNPEPVNGLSLRVPIGESMPEVKARGIGLKRLEREEDDGSFLYLILDLKKTGEVEVSF